MRKVTKQAKKLIPMKKPGFAGPFFQRIGNKLVKSTGNAYGKSNSPKA